MNIVHLIMDLNTGGAEMMLKRLATAHAEDPHYRHHVISFGGMGTIGPQLESAGIAVEALGARSVLDLPRIAFRLHRRLRALRPDVVHCWMYHADLIGGLVARLAGVRQVLWSVRASYLGGGKGGTSRLTSLIRLVCAATSRVIPSRIVYVAHSARRVHERLGYSRAKGVVIPNGYEAPPPVIGPGERMARRERLGLPRDAILIGSVGRFNYLKDHETFVRAAGSVAAVEPAARFVMVGRDVDAGNVALAGWIAAGGHAERFHLLGERGDVAEILSCLDIFCLHSISEAFPNVVAEAMAVGVPCVVTDVGDAALLVCETGLVVKARDAEGLAAALSRLAAEPEAQRRERGLQARDRIAGHYSIEGMIEQYERLYADPKRALVDAAR